MSNVTYAQHVVLSIISANKKASKEELKTIYNEEMSVTRGFELILSQCVKNNFLNEEFKLTDEGKKAVKEDRPEKPEKKERKPRKAKVAFVPPYSDEDIAKMEKKGKEKKVKKMKKANEEALAAFNEEHGGNSTRGTRTPSAYDGKIPVGKFQEKRKTLGNAIRDLWEDIVTPKLLITKDAFIERCESHGINRSTVMVQWSKICKEYEISLEDQKKAGTGEPVTSNDKEEKKKNKEGKKDKEGKKNKKNKEVDDSDIHDDSDDDSTALEDSSVEELIQNEDLLASYKAKFKEEKKAASELADKMKKVLKKVKKAIGE